MLAISEQLEIFLFSLSKLVDPAEEVLLEEEFNDGIDSYGVVEVILLLRPLFLDEDLFYFRLLLHDRELL